MSWFPFIHSTESFKYERFKMATPLEKAWSQIMTAPTKVACAAICSVNYMDQQRYWN